MNNAAGTARLPDGTVDTSFGRLEDVDKVIESVKELSEEGVKTIKEALAKVDDSLAATRKVYESLLKRIQEKGLDYKYEHWSGIHDWAFWDEAVKRAFNLYF